MQRGDTLFSIASIAMLGLGLITHYALPDLSISTYSSGRDWHGSYAFMLQTPCYGIAALFGIFAFLYSIGYIPFSPSMMQWHFWLSSGSLLLFAGGFTGFDFFARRTDTNGPELGTSGILIVIALLVGLAGFLFAQLWFAVGLTRSLLRMHFS